MNKNLIILNLPEWSGLSSDLVTAKDELAQNFPSVTSTT